MNSAVGNFRYWTVHFGETGDMLLFNYSAQFISNENARQVATVGHIKMNSFGTGSSARCYWTIEDSGNNKFLCISLINSQFNYHFMLRMA